MQNQPVGGLLHHQEDEQRNEARIRRILVLFGIWTAVAAALIGFSLVWRDASHMHNPNETKSQIMTIAITLVWGVVLIFVWSMKLTPFLCYRRYLKEIRRGLSRDVQGIAVRVDETVTFRDGLNFYAIIVNIGDPDEPKDERLLYWDAHLAWHGIAVGDRVRLTAHGNDIIGMEGP